ncbi:MAG: hypothetical protein IJ874_08330 [Ruminococcus sp.]|nr:hypothetical protein [Ruminococcus sp.]
MKKDRKKTAAEKKPELHRKNTPEQLELVGKMRSEITRSTASVVSFRLEDTLVITPFPELRDIFRFMEHDFSMLYTGKKSFTELRCAAEDAAQRSGTLTLERIYSILERTAKITPQSREKLMERECELIVYFSFPRSCGLDILEHARKSGKRLVIITELYYPEGTVKRIMSRCGYGGIPLIMYKNKSGSGLIGAISGNTGCTPAEILHIGSSVEDDVEAAVLSGSRSMLLSPVTPVMVRSGRLRGYAEAQHVYDFDTPELFALKCCFGLYAAYGFDIPQNKQPQSDFCGDLHLIGFITLGCLSLREDFEPEDELNKRILAALRSCPECVEGCEDLRTAFEARFSDFLDSFGYADCELPFNFLAEFASPGDKKLLEKYLSAEDYAAWLSRSYEPELAPVRNRTVRKSALSRLADKLFPPGTRVRTIVDGILLKMHR